MMVQDVYTNALEFEVVDFPLGVTGASKRNMLADCFIGSRTDLNKVKSYRVKKMPRLTVYMSDLPYSEQAKEIALSMGLVVGYNVKHKTFMTLYKSA